MWELQLGSKGTTFIDLTKGKRLHTEAYLLSRLIANHNHGINERNNYPTDTISYTTGFPYAYSIINLYTKHFIMPIDLQHLASACSVSVGKKYIKIGAVSGRNLGIYLSKILNKDLKPLLHDQGYLIDCVRSFSSLRKGAIDQNEFLYNSKDVRPREHPEYGFYDTGTYKRGWESNPYICNHTRILRGTLHFKICDIMTAEIVGGGSLELRVLYYFRKQNEYLR